MQFYYSIRDTSFAKEQNSKFTCKFDKTFVLTPLHTSSFLAVAHNCYTEAEKITKSTKYQQYWITLYCQLFTMKIKIDVWTKAPCCHYCSFELVHKHLYKYNIHYFTICSLSNSTSGMHASIEDLCRTSQKGKGEYVC